jgi:hypothetical protein
MAGKASYLAKLAVLAAEYELKETAEEQVQRRLRWEDWGSLLPELVVFAKGEIRRRIWRGARCGVLPEGYDANSIAAEAITAAFRGEARLVIGWTRERLMRELQRKVSNLVRRLHKLKEARAVRSEWEMLRPGVNGKRRSVFEGMKGKTQVAVDEAGLAARDKVRKENELRIAESLEEELTGKLFGCLREGMVKRREIAARLGLSVEEVTNCRKRLDRKLEELGKAGTCPGWVIEEWKSK